MAIMMLPIRASRCQHLFAAIIVCGRYCCGCRYHSLWPSFFVAVIFKPRVCVYVCFMLLRRDVRHHSLCPARRCRALHLPNPNTQECSN